MIVRSQHSRICRVLLLSFLVTLALNVASVAQVKDKQTKPKQTKTKQTKAQKAKTPSQQVVVDQKKSTVDSSRTQKVNEKQLELLPVQANGSVDNYLLLSPGVVPVAGSGTQINGSSGLFSVNGMRARSNNFTVDGADQNDTDMGGLRAGFFASTSQNTESLKEVQVNTSLWNSEDGRNFGSQVTMTTKSGTNNIHGTIYDYFSHSSLNARNYFDNTSDSWSDRWLTGTAYNRFVNGVPTLSKVVRVSIESPGSPFPNYIRQTNPSADKDPFRRNMIGGVIGFPVIKDKTFVFGSFDRQDTNAMRESHFAVPNIEQRGFLNHGARGYVVNTPFAIYQLTPTSVAGSAIFSLFPLPNNPAGPYGENTNTQILSANSRSTLFSSRVDHVFRVFGKTTNLAAKYNFSDDQRDLPSVGNAIYSSVRPKTRAHNISMTATSQFGSTRLNQIRVSFGRMDLNFDELRHKDMIPSELSGEKFLLNAPRTRNRSFPDVEPMFVDMIRYPDVPTELFTGPLGRVSVAPFSPVGHNSSLIPQSRINNTIQIADTMSWFTSKQTYKFGFDIRFNQLDGTLEKYRRPEIIFGGMPDLSDMVAGAPFRNMSYSGTTPGYFNGTDFVSLGIPTSIRQSLSFGTPNSNVDFRSKQLNAFVNDNWKIRSGLTLDFGARYEYNTVPHDADKNLENAFAKLSSSLYSPDPSIGVINNIIGGTLNNTKLFASYDSMIRSLQRVYGGRSDLYEADNNNFSGHLGFAWDIFTNNPRRAGRTVIRGGAGVYTDLSPGILATQSSNLFPSVLPMNLDADTFTIVNGLPFGRPFDFPVASNRFIEFIDASGFSGYPIVKPGTLNTLSLPSNLMPQFLGIISNAARSTGLPSGSGISFTLPDSKYRSPYNLQFNFQIEHELFADTSISLAYAGTRGLKLTRLRTPNGGVNSSTLPLDPTGREFILYSFSVPPLAFTRSSTGRPDPFLGSYEMYESSASSTYHSLQASLAQRLSKGYQVSAAYTWSHAIDDVSDLIDLNGAYNLPQDDSNLRAERGNANFDMRHRLVVNAIGDLPYISRYNNSTGAKRLLLGNWQFSNITTFQTGQPFTVNSSYDVNLDGNLTDRVNNGSAVVVDDQGRQKLKLNTQAWKMLAATGKNGSVGRNTYRSDGLFNVDLAIIKNFKIREGHTLVFRTEAFNLLNKTHFGIPVRILEAPNFGQSVDTSVNSRQLQFALKYVF